MRLLISAHEGSACRHCWPKWEGLHTSPPVTNAQRHIYLFIHLPRAVLVATASQIGRGLLLVGFVSGNASDTIEGA